MGKQILSKSADITGLEPDKNQRFDCTSCGIGKSARPHHPKVDQRAERVGACVMVDFWGPFRVPGLNGEKYLLNFIDSHSRFSYMIAVQSKTDFLKCFQQVVLYYKSLGHSISEIRADNDSVIKDRNVQLWANNNGIRFTWTPPYSHESNGVVERHWRTITEMAYTFLLSSGVSLKFWTYAALHSNYIRNRLPHKALGKNVTPYELMFSKRPDMRNVRIFGCTAYAHIDASLRKKLDDRALQCIYLGQDPFSSGFLLYSQNQNRVVSRGMVRFVEEYDRNGNLLVQSQAKDDCIELIRTQERMGVQDTVMESPDDVPNSVPNSVPEISAPQTIPFSESGLTGCSKCRYSLTGCKACNPNKYIQQQSVPIVPQNTPFPDPQNEPEPSFVPEPEPPEPKNLFNPADICCDKRKYSDIQDILDYYCIPETKTSDSNSWTVQVGVVKLKLLSGRIIWVTLKQVLGFEGIADTSDFPKSC